MSQIEEKINSSQSILFIERRYDVKYGRLQSVQRVILFFARFCGYLELSQNISDTQNKTIRIESVNQLGQQSVSDSNGVRERAIIQYVTTVLW